MNTETTGALTSNSETAKPPVQSEAALILLKNLQDTLNEEKWTRASLGNYSTNQFKELDTILKSAREEKVVNELKKSCDDHLSHTRNSIIALYLSGMIALSRQIIDDAAIINLVSIFLDNHKWNIVKYLCERILDHGESKYALRTLADCYKNDNEEEKVFSIWERLVKVDFEECDIVKALAEYYEKQNNKEQTVDYYKKALHRYVNKGNFSNVKEIWEKLVAINTEDIDFFLHIQKKIAKTISEDKAVILLNELYSEYKDIDIDIAINILKIVLDYDDKDNHARKEIIECFRKKYSFHSQLEEYIRISNLSQNYRSVHQAISDFEKHIAFDKGNFVYHRTWGVGRIASIAGDVIKIDFSKERDRSMSLKMAVDALKTLSKDHIWVKKATMKKEELRDRIKDKKDDVKNENIIWALKTIIKSFDNACDMKRIKQELSPALLTAGEWSTWSSKARDILKSNPDFAVSQENNDIFMVRERPVTVTEKLHNEFMAQSDFYAKAAIIRDYIKSDQTSPYSDLFSEMLKYFTDYLYKTDSKPDSKTQAKSSAEYAVASFLLINELASYEDKEKNEKKYSHIMTEIKKSFADIMENKNPDDYSALFKKLKDKNLKEEFLKNVKLFIPQWPDIYIKLFSVSQDLTISEQLEKAGFKDKLSGLCNDCFDHFREAREAVVWIYKNAGKKDWFKDANISDEKQLITLIHILNITYRDIENNKETIENRKINRLVHNILFKEGKLASFIDNSDEEAIIRIFTFINGVKDLDPQDKQNLRARILDKFPAFKFLGDTEKKEIYMGLWVTHAMYEEKKKLQAHINDVEVPANSREIDEARDQGDLKENAEYKAAKEKQEQLKFQLAKLNEEFEKAQLFDPNSINTTKVSFGTKVSLYNETDEKHEAYTILGPWESDPNNNIISYLSPFGKALISRKQGEKFISAGDEDGKRISYLVENIEAAEF